MTNHYIALSTAVGFRPPQERVLCFLRTDWPTSPCWPWLPHWSCKGSRRPISLMRTHNPLYARSENHTQLAKMSFDKIFDIIAVVYFDFLKYTREYMIFFFVRDSFRSFVLLSSLVLFSAVVFSVKWFFSSAVLGGWLQRPLCFLPDWHVNQNADGCWPWLARKYQKYSIYGRSSRDFGLFFDVCSAWTISEIGIKFETVVVAHVLSYGSMLSNVRAASCLHGLEQWKHVKLFWGGLKRPLLLLIRSAPWRERGWMLCETIDKTQQNMYLKEGLLSLG